MMISKDGNEIKCSKCGEDIKEISHFFVPDEIGVCMMLIHSYKIVDTPLGKTKSIDKVCFLTEDDMSEELLLLRKEYLKSETV